MNNCIVEAESTADSSFLRLPSVIRNRTELTGIEADAIVRERFRVLTCK